MKIARSNERGMASFLITLFIMLVIGLIVMGFAQLSRRDQRQSLDRQLSVQAQYAAETAINDAKRYVQQHPDYTKSDCNEASPGQLIPGYSDVLDSTRGVSYTCVLINSTPGDLKKQGVDINTSLVFPIQLSTGAPISTITLTWSSETAGATAQGCPAAGSYPQTRAGTCQIPVLRADVVPYGQAQSPTRDGLVNTLYTIFANPVNGGAGTATYAAANGGNADNVEGNCTAGANTCTLTISLPGNVDRYYMRLNSIYGLSDIIVSANSHSPLVGAQAVIDATGKAQDIVKRIQVSIPINGTTDIPTFALQTQNSQCKRYGIIPSNNYAFLVSPNDDCSLN